MQARRNVIKRPDYSDLKRVRGLLVPFFIGGGGRGGRSYNFTLSFSKFKTISIFPPTLFRSTTLVVLVMARILNSSRLGQKTLMITV